MAYTSGTAATDIELYQALITFLTTGIGDGQNWGLLGRESVATGNTVSDFASLKGPGFNGTDNVFVHLEHYQAPLTDTFSFRIVGSAGYLASALATPGLQPDNTMTNTSWSGNVIVRLPVHRNPINYWIVANGRRFILVTYIGSNWSVMHGGLILPDAFPAQYPYPLLVGASNNTTDSYQAPPQSNFMFTAVTTQQAGALRTPGGNWVGGPYGVGAGAGLGRYSCWPWDRGVVSVGGTWQAVANSPRLSNMVPTVDINGNEVYIPLPVRLISRADNAAKAIYGTLDGLYMVNAFNAIAGDTLTIGDDTYLIFQLEGNNTNAYHFALKLA